MKLFRTLEECRSRCIGGECLVRSIAHCFGNGAHSFRLCAGTRLGLTIPCHTTITQTVEIDQLAHNREHRREWYTLDFSYSSRHSRHSGDSRSAWLGLFAGSMSARASLSLVISLCAVPRNRASRIEHHSDLLYERWRIVRPGFRREGSRAAVGPGGRIIVVPAAVRTVQPPSPYHDLLETHGLPSGSRPSPTSRTFRRPPKPTPRSCGAGLLAFDRNVA